MEDRFKFRVFLKYNQIMCDIDSYCFLQGLNKCVFHFTNSGQKTLKNDDFILMQCTGLKDKNGKLIYEGDIVKFKDQIKINGSKTHISVVEFNEQFNTYMYHAECMGLYTINKAQNKQFDVEVIGNIYENPELLED